MRNLREILLKILNIIEYDEDKETYINNFIALVQKRTLLQLINSLPSEKQEIIKHQLSSNPSTENIFAILNESFTNETRDATISEVTTSMMSEYLKSIEGTLTDAQKEEVAAYVSSVNITAN